MKPVMLSLIALLLVSAAGAFAFQDEAEPCQFSAERAANVAVRTGPGFGRSILAFLEDGNYTPLREVEAEDGSRWYELNKDEALSAEQAAVVLEAWVPARRVRLTGDCADVRIPPTIERVEDCAAVVAEGARAPLRNNPNRDARLIRRLPAGEYGILNQTVVRGNIWYELDTADTLPNRENPRVRTWVASLRVTASGTCVVVPAPAATEEAIPAES